MKRDVAVLAAVRTPIGRFGGGLAAVPAVDLAVVAVRAALERSGLEPGQVDGLILGLARGAGCGPNPARQVAVRSGLPVAVPAYTVNQACASGLAAILQGASQIRAGEARVVIAAGAESMSRVPYLLEEVRWGLRSGHRQLVDGMYRDGFLCPLAGMTMGETAEKLARRYGISRQEQDAWALRSQERCRQAWEEGRFAAEIVPVAGVERDEHPRPQTTLESLARLPGAFSPEGTVT
ncbi:MAG TPA: beta-ketoacyl synthase N-terminal-like domain-containing protein, partial [Candidatus Nitrosotenuis sp.]|nr:beta-ketoacyl synthase N-terminal-like domain-containing protein [Candidatus Nitrosotenuis sp.]